MAIKKVIRSALTAALTLAALLLAGCATGDSGFLLSRLDDRDKAGVLTAKGIARFEGDIVKKEKYSTLADVRLYFETALRYDPTNKEAGGYLRKIDSYAADTVAARLNQAKASLALRRRTADQTYALLYAVEKAYELDPANAAVRSLRDATRAERDAFVRSVVGRSRAMTNRLSAKASFAAKKENYLAALAVARKALAVDPQNPEANGERRRLADAIIGLLNEDLAIARALIAKGRLSQADRVAQECVALNEAVDNERDGDNDSLTYDLHLAWARYFLAQKDYARAELRAGWAIDARKSDEAVALLNEIRKREGGAASGLSGRAASAAEFGTALRQIDALVADDALAAAQARVNDLRRTETAPARVSALASRQKAVNGRLKTIYDLALSRYQDDDFERAIALLQIVVLADPGYELASSYLGKAVAKQRLLQSY